MSQPSIWRSAISLAGILVLSVTSPFGSSDGDGDGIDDDVEAQLAADFLPEIRYHEDESCSAPGSRPILFRLRYASKNGIENTNFIAINYVRLYSADCAPIAHDGDNEAFLVFLELVNGNWTFASLAATAHSGAWPVEVSTASFDPLLWVGKDKHGGFAEISECESNIGFLVDDHCDWDGPTYSHTLHNVGEPSDWLLNSLAEIDSEWDEDYIWNDQDEQFLDAGDIRASLFTSNFIHLTPVPGLQACLTTCQAESKQCLMQNPLEYCLAVKDNCDYSCYVGYARWDP